MAPQSGDLRESTKEMMGKTAELRVELEKFMACHPWSLNLDTEVRQGLETMISSLSSERALQYEPDSKWAMYLYGSGLLVPTEPWKPEWERYKADPNSWNGVERGHQQWQAQRDNKRLRNLYACVWNIPEGLAAWNQISKTCEDTIQALLHYRNILGPDDTYRIERVSGRDISILVPPSSWERDEDGSWKATFSVGGTKYEPALVYDCDDETGMERLAHELTLSYSPYERSELRRRAELMMKALDTTSELDRLYASQIQSYFPPLDEVQGQSTTIIPSHS
jgi:hypothetical protein